ncbi:T9SS type A sorting domain-containing protein [Prevotella sp. kh1p2]|uniref:T9SS type A sorting domain-containing protein n=1 Tax=Prevotella sp. kh1p2 TaxID=1761883 RepID=UPI0008C32325|nr:T9SS type A sorting domain-containing protein [Prevotella sp. kh1p2]SES69864.1 hypothetical protein SAMN04487825_102113 [Prevotella sp. kh1p2]SNU10335.1 hypothetical protein SAMN06298210_10297 [Prevotellaceae bacterium KH2P17]
MKRTFTLWGIAMALLWLFAPCSSMAQGQDGNHEWVGNSISTVINNADADMNTVFLYNVGTHKFLNVGSHWGTSVSAYNVGMPIKVTNGDNGLYRMQGVTNTPEGNNIAFGRKMDTQDNDPVSWNRVYCDRSTQINGHNNGIRDWKFEETSAGSKTYKISCFNDEWQYNMQGNRYLHVMSGPTDGSNRLELDYPGTVNDNNGLWKIVTLKDMKEAFKEQYASDEDPADASFLIHDQDFNRSNIKVGEWKADSRFSYAMVDGTTYRFYPDGRYTYYVGMGCYRSNAYQRSYGRYWIGSVRNVNRNANANGSLTQTVTTLKKGWYRVSCDGFYSPGVQTPTWQWPWLQPSSSLKSYLFANVQGQSNGSSSVSTLLNVFKKEFSYTVDELTHEYTDQETQRESPYVKAAKLFEKGKYTNSIMVYVPNDGDKLDIGIRVEGSNMPADWTAFDNFQLQYCGNRDLVLDEMQTSVDYMVQQADANNAYTLILKRTLKEGIWNTITLPVSLTAAQFKTAFGSDAKLSKLEGQDPNRKSRIIFKSVNLSDDNTNAIEAGKLYIMMPTHGANVTGGEYKKTLKSGTTITVQAPYFVINNVTLAAAPEAIVKEQSKPTTTIDGKLQFCGSMIKQDTNIVPAYSYVLGANDGKWYFTQSDLSINGFRCWIATGDAAAAKFFTFSIDGQDFGTVTAIDGIETDNSTESGTVYNLNGQVVRSNATSLEGLPKGVYIYNKRKIIVK